MKINKKNNVIKNTIMLYMMSFAKIIFPLVTLPYLTRVLSVNAYGVVAYVKSFIVYTQIIVEFGFILSATKDIVNVRENNKKVNYVLSTTIFAKSLIAVLGSVMVAFCIMFIPLLHENAIYTWLSYMVVVLGIFLPDFLFSGIEKMEMITTRFVVSKSISTFLTFFVVKNDNDLIFIPVLELLGTSVAVILTWCEIYKLDYRIIKVEFKSIVKAIRVSFVFFVSDAATTAFGAFNTLVIGMMLSRNEIAYWSVAMQLIAAAQALYNPIMNGIYPHMIRTKSLKLIKMILLIFMPLITVATIISDVFAKFILVIISGPQYASATYVFRLLSPLLVVSFPAMLFGWPTLGALNKQNQTTVTTVLASLVQIGLVIFLIVIGKFSLFWIACARLISETVLLSSRVYYNLRYKNEFKK